MPPKPSRKSAKAEKNRKHAAARAALEPEAEDDTVTEQALLDLFNSTFRTLITSRGLTERIQKVKGALFERNYAAAFGEPENLEAYVVRWSPSRALAYRWVFSQLLRGVMRNILCPGKGEEKEIVCIGAGAGGEVVGFAGAIAEMNKGQKGGNEEGEMLERGKIKLTAIDNADWGPIFDKLVAGISSPKALGDPPRPTFQLPDSPVFEASYLNADVLSNDFPVTTIISQTSLITLLFTTNELYKQSMAKATAFLLSLRQRTSSGCLLLVLESAGSYSTVRMTVAGVEKEYPMGSFLDYTMVGDGERGWEKVKDMESEWYRLPQGLRYPVELENMRFLVKVYKRIEDE